MPVGHAVEVAVNVDVTAHRRAVDVDGVLEGIGLEGGVIGTPVVDEVVVALREAVRVPVHVERAEHDGAIDVESRFAVGEAVGHRSTIAMDRRRCANQPGKQRPRQAMACGSGGPRWRGGHQHHDPGQKRDLHEPVDKKKKVIHT